MKRLILFICLPFFCFSQKYKAIETKTTFFSYAPLENITASSEELKGVVDLNTGEFFFRLPIKSFSFKRALMQTHFNDKYMESDKFPNSTFKGKSEKLKEQIEIILNKQKSYKKESGSIKDQFSELFNQGILIEALLNIHGEEKNIKTKVLLDLEEDKIRFLTIFFVETDDFKIKIPKLLKDNISEKIEVKVSGFLEDLK
tara:strand:+ start:503 stop:1102 length:600 start_codon:yes stop_codon:yes gene_type:complete